MSNYHDRGILKWAPFDALTGQHTVIEEMIYNINKKEKAVLSDDEYEETDATLKEAFEKNKNVSIDYFKDGYTFTTFGFIKKIDSVKKAIKLDTEETILLEDIIQIKIVR